MLRNACTCALLLALCAGCMPPPRDVVTVTIRSSQPIREAQDTDTLKSFYGPLQTAAVAVAGILTNTDIALPLVAAIGGHVGVRFIERTSDAEFEFTTITVPVAPGQSVTITAEPGGATTVIVGVDAQAPDAEALEGAPEPPQAEGSGLDAPFNAPALLRSDTR